MISDMVVVDAVVHPYDEFFGDFSYKTV